MVDDRQDGPVRWLTLDKPDRLNSFVATDYRDLGRCVERGQADAATRVLVVTGRGRAFSAGADRSLVDGSATDDERAEAKDEFLRFLEVLAGCDKPLIAAVNGLAVGIGSTMLLYFDLVLAAASARFRFPFTALGLTPEAGSSYLLAARARWDEAVWAMLSSEWIDAPSAREMGLAWRVVPDDQLIEEAGGVAHRLAGLPPESVQATKRLLLAGRADPAGGAAAAIARELDEMSRLTRPPSGA